MLAEARGKFNTIAGPQGGTSLNADALRSDAQMLWTNLKMIPIMLKVKQDLA